MEKISFLILNDSLNQNYLVKNSLQGKWKGNHSDAFDFGKMKKLFCLNDFKRGFDREKFFRFFSSSRCSGKQIETE